MAPIPPNMLQQAAQKAMSSLRPDDEDDQSQEEDSDVSQFEDPRNQDEDGTCLYLDKDMFGHKVVKGDEVMIRGTVKSLGSKIGVIPDEIMKAKPGDEGSAEEESKESPDEESAEDDQQFGKY